MITPYPVNKDDILPIVPSKPERKISFISDKDQIKVRKNGSIWEVFTFLSPNRNTWRWFKVDEKIAYWYVNVFGAEQLPDVNKESKETSSDVVPTENDSAELAQLKADSRVAMRVLIRMELDSASASDIYKQTCLIEDCLKKVREQRIQDVRNNSRH